LLGDNILVEDLRIRNVGLSGILVRTAGASGNPGQASLVLHHNTVQLTGTYGIKTYGGAITDNAIDRAGGIGIGVQGLGGAGGAVVVRVVIAHGGAVRA